MLSTAIGVLALAANPAPPAAHEVWEADIATSAPSSVYLVQLDDQLEHASKNLNPDWFDVIDAQGRTMPRGFWQSLNGGPREDVSLAVANKRELRALPQACAQQPKLPACAVFEHEPKMDASRATMDQRLKGMFPMPGSSDRFIVASVRSPSPPPPIPLRWDVVDLAAPPAGSSEWNSRSLLVRWKSHLAPTAIAWQIGGDAAAITPTDRALLDEDQASFDFWNLRLAHAWHRYGRLAAFGTLNATQGEDGVWKAEIPLKELSAEDVLQIASAPVGAVELVDVHLLGNAPRSTPDLQTAKQPLRLVAKQNGQWNITDAWPQSATFAEIRFTREQTQTLLDNHVEKVVYELQAASGKVQTAIVFPFQESWQSNPWRGVAATVSTNIADPWLVLKQSIPADALPAPELIATYSTRVVWFEAYGTAPYRLKLGMKSARRPDQMSSDAAEHLGTGRKMPDATVHLPLASLQNVRKTGTFSEPTPERTDGQEQSTRINRFAEFIAALGAIAVAVLAAIDGKLRRKLAAARRGDA